MPDNDILDARDERILAEVRELFSRLDPTPADLPERIKFALTVQALQAEIAELTSPQLALTRGMGEPDETATVTFSTEAVSIMLSMSAAGSGTGTRVDGWLTCGAAEIELTDSQGQVRRTRADEGGRFAFDAIPAGPTRLLVRDVSGLSRPIITRTFTI